MLKSLVLVLALVVCAFSLSAREQQFRSWMKQYNKVYADDVEYAQRFENFQKTLAKIEKQTMQNKPGVKFALNLFADISEEEFARTRLAPKVSAQGLATSCLATGTSAKLSADVSDLPDSWDWRPKGAVTPVKDQGVCGSCWAFSATGNIEGQYFLKYNQLVSFSEQLLVDCSQACCNIPGEGQACNGGCNGGFQWNAFQDLMDWGGMETEAEYPYTSGNTGANGNCQKDNSKLMGKFSNYTCLSAADGSTSPADEAQMANYMLTNGPLAIALNAGYLQTYSGGVIDPWFPSLECDPTALDHGVLIVGWGIEQSEFGNVDYWIVKNSWSSQWGENGYFRIKRGGNICGVAMAVSSVTY